MSDADVLVAAMLEGTSAGHFVGIDGDQYLTMNGEYAYPVPLEAAVAYFRITGDKPEPPRTRAKAARRAYSELLEALK